MSSNGKCKATLKSGKPCVYAAKGKSKYCGIHAPRRKRKEPSNEKQRARTERDAKLALVVSTGLALIEIIEKAVAHYPALRTFLESFAEFASGGWRYTEVMPELEALAAYQSSMDPNALAEVIGGDQFYQASLHPGALEKLIRSDPSRPDEITTTAAIENAAIVIAIHNLALTHWASSTVLAKFGPDPSAFGSFGHLLLSKARPLSNEEYNALLQINRMCRQIPFVDKLRPKFFSCMWGDDDA